jgi:predicted dehydrogenase
LAEGDTGGLARRGGTGKVINVAIVGAGGVTQSIHIPVLRRLSDRFTLHRIWDIDRDRCQAVADQAGMGTADTLAELLADDSVDVVAICSPARFHAEHTIAAMKAGIKAVLVEKPVCNQFGEIEELAAVAERTGALVLSGSMHLYDPAWKEAERMRTERGFVPHSIASTILLPPNDRFMPWAFEPAEVGGGGGGGQHFSPSELMRLAVMELAIHDLPLVRRMLPDDAPPKVIAAKMLQPFGYAVSMEAGGVLIDLFALAHGQWQTDWRIEATGKDAQLQLSFTPSFVHAGSGQFRWSEKGRSVLTEPAQENGYVHEWLKLARIIDGEEPAPDIGDLVRDYRFICLLADQACELIAQGEEA